MKILRRIVRYSFFASALTFVGIIVGLIKHPEFAVLHGEVRYYAMFAGNALLAVLYGAAYITTWKRSPYRNNWAVAACSLWLIVGIILAVVVYRAMPGDLRAETPLLVIILVNVGGLYLYAPGGTPAQSEPAAQPAVSDGSMQPVPQAGSFPLLTVPAAPTPLAPSLAGASSPELAAAAASPGDPNAPWDPLACLRTPEILQKMRS